MDGKQVQAQLDELAADIDASGPTERLVRRAIRLATTAGLADFRTLFELHLNGQPESEQLKRQGFRTSPWRPGVDASEWNPYAAFVEDRSVSEEAILGMSARELDKMVEQTKASLVSMARTAQTKPHYVNLIQPQYRERLGRLESVVDRIRCRVQLLDTTVRRMLASTMQPEQLRPDVDAIPIRSQIDYTSQVPSVFISHASEDKNDIARPLAESLRALSIQVWYDEYSLSLGDSLSASIDRGIAASDFGVVIISPSFISKQWPQRELAGLVSREVGEARKVILPVWHSITAEQVRQFSPTLADKLAITTDRGVDQVAQAIAAALSTGSTRLPTDGPSPATTLPSGLAPDTFSLSVDILPRGSSATVSARRLEEGLWKSLPETTRLLQESFFPMARRANPLRMNRTGVGIEMATEERRSHLDLQTSGKISVIELNRSHASRPVLQVTTLVRKIARTVALASNWAREVLNVSDVDVRMRLFGADRPVNLGLEPTFLEHFSLLGFQSAFSLPAGTNFEAVAIVAANADERRLSEIAYELQADLLFPFRVPAGPTNPTERSIAYKPEAVLRLLRDASEDRWG